MLVLFIVRERERERGRERERERESERERERERLASRIWSRKDPLQLLIQFQTWELLATIDKMKPTRKNKNIKVSTRHSTVLSNYLQIILCLLK